MGSLCKASGTCHVIFGKGCWFVGDGHAFYKMPAQFPAIEEPEQMAAVFGYTDKDREKILFSDTPTDEFAVDLRDNGPEEWPCETQEVGLILEDAGIEVMALLAEDGEAGLIDRKMLAPLADAIKNDGYLAWYRRRTKTGAPIYILKDGMEMLGAFCPVLFKKLDRLQDIVTGCALALERADIRKRDRQTDEEAEGEDG